MSGVEHQAAKQLPRSMAQYGSYECRGRRHVGKRAGLRQCLGRTALGQRHSRMQPGYLGRAKARHCQQPAGRQFQQRPEAAELEQQRLRQIERRNPGRASPQADTQQLGRGQRLSATGKEAFTGPEANPGVRPDDASVRLADAHPAGARCATFAPVWLRNPQIFCSASAAASLRTRRHSLYEI